MKNNIHRFDSISEFHKLSGLPKPEHPLVSLVDYGKIDYQTDSDEISWVQNFYSVGLKRNINGKFKYGQQQYDFDEGLMSFVSPGQLVHIVINRTEEIKPTGFLLCIHPDFLWNTPLAKKIKQYDFFSYSINEALFMSEKEENIIEGIMQIIQQEYHSNIDKFSQNIIVAQIELLFNYCERFYQRQFITRKISSHQILERLEEILTKYFESSDLQHKGLPNVQYISNELNVSATYLSSLLKVLTGKSTQHHIHEKLIEKAKEKLSTTSLTVSEIAFDLGFEHSQSFSKLFKSKTNVSPIEFRQSFN
ncbi:helix-turn-helix domain-containing protein [Flavobacterium sp. HTF]|uniref:helix-turn-helix domain-containing protein n=1 Tax=Flavobacterium sp. HTF TaxID=2170732 RepID=UPI000D5D3367|nr:response regulator transcription factor [Flavobacterium sp. HTF]PWB22508.1 AraC family transcriptional regulator [Flavobacterium sp. HTF]